MKGPNIFFRFDQSRVATRGWELFKDVHRSRSCPPLTGIAKIIDWKADIAQSKAVSCIISHSEAENSEAAQAQEEKADS